MVQLEPVTDCLVSVSVLVPRVTAITGKTVPALVESSIMMTIGLPEFCPCCAGVDASGMFMLCVIVAVVSVSPKLTLATTRESGNICAAVGATPAGFV